MTDNWPDELLNEMLKRYDAARKRNWDAFWDKHFPDHERKRDE